MFLLGETSEKNVRAFSNNDRNWREEEAEEEETAAAAAK